jgi:hypothetical protein
MANVPGIHDTGVEDVLSGQAKPAGHDVQLVCPGPEKLPSGHKAGVMLGAGQYMPGAQILQVVLAVVLLVSIERQKRQIVSMVMCTYRSP